MNIFFSVGIALISLSMTMNAAQTLDSNSFRSPIVHKDGTVTFNLRAPNAKQVEISGQFLPRNQPLQNGGNGLWSITVGPIEPDLYPYNFVVDGVATSDPSNTETFPNEGFKASLVDIPSADPALYTIQNVPHGQLNYCYYQSKTVGGTRPLIVYTPPGYRESSRRYPVLYLVSGTTDTEETWFKVGKANFILDNLIAQKRAEPMIIVMPYGNMMKGTPAPSSLRAAEMYRDFNDELVGSVLPYVEANFRTARKREMRAIAGFSRGGGQSLFTGFNNLDKFASIGSYSAYLTPEVFDRYFGRLAARPQAINKQLKLLWLGVGKTDFLYEPAKEFVAMLDEKKIDHKSLVTEGGHTWMNARRYLAETLQLYFK